jgi:endonuclease G, mitochondrial
MELDKSRSEQVEDLGRTDVRNRRIVLARATIERTDPPTEGSKGLEVLSFDETFVDSALDHTFDHSAQAEGVQAAAPRVEATLEERFIGRDDLVDECYLDRALLAARSVCRIVVEVAGKRESATGFLVGSGFLMTNWHVFKTAEAAVGARVCFGYRTKLNLDTDPGVSFFVTPERGYRSNENLDVCVVAISPRSADGDVPLDRFGNLVLFSAPAKGNIGDAMTIIQHPRGEPRKIALRENRLEAYGDDTVDYSSDTAPGSSGSPVFLDDFRVAALHRQGVPRMVGAQFQLRDNRLVDTLKGIDDTDVVYVTNRGTRVSSICTWLRTANDDALLAPLLASIDVAPKLDESTQIAAVEILQTSNGMSTSTPHAISGVGTTSANIATLDVPVRIQVTIGELAPSLVGSSPTPVATTAPSLQQGVATESGVVPFIDTDYENRTGYDSRFLGVTVAPPKLNATARKQLVKIGNATAIRYEHFSVWLRRDRRIATMVASNVDWNDDVRSSLNRKEISELGPNDREAWATDPRLPDEVQLPDVFYDKDRQSFDKGHLVRRDDVCWGLDKDLEVIRRANGDTFHVTNCSPQRSDFNRSTLDDRGWGDLENLVQKTKGTRRYCVFAGPVFDDEHDMVFQGRDNRGKTQVQIPSAFWKVVVEVIEGKLQTYAFLLQQDLSEVQFNELDVTADWTARQITVAGLEQRLGTLKFSTAVRNADAFSG